jgi:hypothetical protein
MSKKSDDSIERIFRQALTQYDTKFQESDWAKMEKLLDEEASRRAAARSRRIKGTAYTLTGLTGLIIAVYFLAIKNPSDRLASLSDSVTEMQATEDLTKNGNVQHEIQSDGLLSKPLTLDSKPPGKDGSDQTAGETEAIASQPLEPDQLKQSDPDVTVDSLKETPVAPFKGDKEDGAETGPRLPATSRVLPKKNNSAAQGVLADVEISRPNENKALSPDVNLTNNSDPSLTTPVTDNDVQDIANEKIALDHDVLAVPAVPSESGSLEQVTSKETQDTAADQPTQNTMTVAPGEGVSAIGKDTSALKRVTILSQPEDPAINSKQTEGKQKVKPTSRWSVGIIFAPEFSTINLGSYSAPGTSFGLRIAYQISSRFSVNTGLIRSTKKYEDSGDSYQPRNPAYWQIRTNGVIPEEIYSNCLVYELPVGVQFDAIQTQKSRVYISTAISSYFMTSQAYDYTYSSPNPGADMGWRSPRAENYWFSVGMVSAGYERYIHRSLALGIEPYLKFSLSEIGWPNIKLFSTGAYVTLRYRFMMKRDLE